MARARTASGARASTCSRASTRACERMGLEYVDIFYSHRFDPETPLEETMGALATAVAQGKALYVGHLVVLAGAHRRGGGDPRATSGTPLLIHQPSYSLLNRWIENGLLDDARARWASAASPSRRSRRGCSTDKYLDGIPEGSRASQAGGSLSPRAADRRDARARARARTRSRRARPDARADGARLDAARSAGDVDARRREQRRAARGERRRARPARLHRATSSPRSTATPPTATINLWARSSAV